MFALPETSASSASRKIRSVFVREETIKTHEYEHTYIHTSDVAEK